MPPPHKEGRLEEEAGAGFLLEKQWGEEERWRQWLVWACRFPVATEIQCSPHPPRALAAPTAPGNTLTALGRPTAYGS